MLKLSDNETLLRIYYGNSELGTAEISAMFGGGVARSTISALKKKVLYGMAERGIPQHRTGVVDTGTAFEVFGIDVVDIEKKYKKLKQLGV